MFNHHLPYIQTQTVPQCSNRERPLKKTMQSFREYGRKKLSLQTTCSITAVISKTRAEACAQLDLHYHELFTEVLHFVSLAQQYCVFSPLSYQNGNIQCQSAWFSMRIAVILSSEGNSTIRWILSAKNTIKWYVVTTMIKGVSRQVKPTRIQSDFSTNNISKSVSLEFKLFPLLYNYGFIFQVFSIAPRENQQEQFSIFRLTGLLLLIRDIQWYTSNLGTVQYLTDPQDSVQLFLTHYSMWCIKMF